MSYRLVPILLLLGATACTRASLTDSHIVLRGATRGDVPRDVNGDPIMDRVKPPPAGAILATPPPPVATTPQR